MDNTNDYEFTLDEACFLKNEGLILKGFVPFNFSCHCLVHPTRITMETVRSICVHDCCDWFEEAITLLTFIHSRHEDVAPRLYQSIITTLKQMAILNIMVADISVNKEQSREAIDKYFSLEGETLPIRQELLKLLDIKEHFFGVVYRKITADRHHHSHNFMDMLGKYFEAVEQTLPLPLKASDINFAGNNEKQTCTSKEEHAESRDIKEGGVTTSGLPIGIKMTKQSTHYNDKEEFVVNNNVGTCTVTSNDANTSTNIALDRKDYCCIEEPPLHTSVLGCLGTRGNEVNSNANNNNNCLPPNKSQVISNGEKRPVIKEDQPVADNYCSKSINNIESTALKDLSCIELLPQETTAGSNDDELSAEVPTTSNDEMEYTDSNTSDETSDTEDPFYNSEEDKAMNNVDYLDLVDWKVKGTGNQPEEPMMLSVTKRVHHDDDGLESFSNSDAANSYSDTD